MSNLEEIIKLPGKIEIIDSNECFEGYLWKTGEIVYCKGRKCILILKYLVNSKIDLEKVNMFYESINRIEGIKEVKLEAEEKIMRIFVRYDKRYISNREVEEEIMNQLGKLIK